MERRSNRITIMLFLLAVFVMLALFTGGWIYKMYKEQTAYSEAKTLATVECGKYYFSIDPTTVTYFNNTLYFEVENTLGADIETFTVRSGAVEKDVLVSLSRGFTQPVSVDIELDGSVMIYPKGCGEINFKNLSFEQS